ncbi:hypothetical protein [Streptomyces sp. bgisy126]|uniref:hypothetical protein n=1 Tax=unclassified Streptomyces TaxID=2593676 RepID=UPI003EC0E252
MSSTSDGPGDGPGRLIPFPPGGDVTDRPVPLADIDRLIPPAREIPPESAMERTIELPPVREPISPESVLRAESAPAYSPTEEEYGETKESGEYEYEPSRTFMERVGDWLEYRIARGHAGLEVEGPYREAVIEAKVARLKADSEREIALLEAHNKLRQAGIQAAADKKTAQGKGDTAAAKSGSGTSASGGGRGGLGGARGGSGGGRGGGSGGGSAGGGRNTSGSGGGRGGAGSGADKGGRKDVRSSAAQSPAAAKANEDKRRRKDQPRQERHRAGEQSPAGGGRGGTGGGKDRGRGNAGGSGGASPRQERTAARQSAHAERRAERGRARDQRRAAEQAAGLSDRAKDRDQARAERQRARDKDWADREARQEQENKDRSERGAARQARREKRKARRQEKKTAGAGRTTLGKAVGDEAQRRFDKRRKAAEETRAAKDGKDGKAGEEKTKAEPGTGKPADGYGAETVQEKTGAEKPGPDTGDVKKDDGKTEPSSEETEETAGCKTTEPGTGESAEEPEKDGAGKATESGTSKASEEPGKKSGSAGGETGKPAGPEESTTAAKGPESPSEPPAGKPADTEPEEVEIVEEKPSGGSETTGDSTPEQPAAKRSFGGRIKDRLTKNKLPEEGARTPLWMEAEGERARPPIRPKAEDDIIEAHIIEPDDAESPETDGAETPVSDPEIAQIYTPICRFYKEPWTRETYSPSRKKAPQSPAATDPPTAFKKPSGSGGMDGESGETWDLYHPDPPRTGSGKPAAEADTAPPGPGTPVAGDAKPFKERESSAFGEASVNKRDALAHLTDAQIVGFLVSGHSRPPAPSTPVWDDTATPAAATPADSGPEAGIPAQSAPPDTTSKEAPPMSTTPASSGSQLAAKHRTDITFDQYLVVMTNISLDALGDKEMADDLVKRLLATVKALFEIAADLADDHNLDKRTVSEINDLSEALSEMQAQAARCAQECADAAEAAVHAAGGVARVYGQDMDAKRDAGLTYTSAAAHHD